MVKQISNCLVYLLTAIVVIVVVRALVASCFMAFFAGLPFPVNALQLFKELLPSYSWHYVVTGFEGLIYCIAGIVAWVCFRQPKYGMIVELYWVAVCVAVEFVPITGGCFIVNVFVTLLSGIVAGFLVGLIHIFWFMPRPSLSPSQSSSPPSSGQ